MNDGPLTWEMDSGFDKAVRQELVTYYIEDGYMIRSKVERVYSEDSDYFDSTTKSVLGMPNG